MPAKTKTATYTKNNKQYQEDYDFRNMIKNKYLKSNLDYNQAQMYENTTTKDYYDCNTLDDEDYNGLLLDKASRHYENGYALYHSDKYDAAIEELNKSLRIRENYLGLYHDDTAKVYRWLGYTYSMMDSDSKNGKSAYRSKDYKNNRNHNDDAIIASHTGLRIEKYLKGDDDDDMDDFFDSLMEGRGPKNYKNSKKFGDTGKSNETMMLHHHYLFTKKITKDGKQHGQAFSNKEVRRYHASLSTSLNYEKEADKYRKTGDFVKAWENYNKAIRHENNCTGNDVTVCYLWRKLACLLGKCGVIATVSTYDIKKELRKRSNGDNNNNSIYSDNSPSSIQTTLSRNWKQIDCIIPEGDKVNRQGLLDDVFELVRRGDISYAKSKYQQALETYQKATTIVTDAEMAVACSKVAAATPSMFSSTNDDRKDPTENSNGFLELQFESRIQQRKPDKEEKYKIIELPTQETSLTEDTYNTRNRNTSQLGEDREPRYDDRRLWKQQEEKRTISTMPTQETFHTEDSYSTRTRNMSRRTMEPLEQRHAYDDRHRYGYEDRQRYGYDNKQRYAYDDKPQDPRSLQNELNEKMERLQLDMMKHLDEKMDAFQRKILERTQSATTERVQLNDNLRSVMNQQRDMMKQVDNTMNKLRQSLE